MTNATLGSKTMDCKIAERFWSKVERTEGCWIWRGSYFSNGYGAFWRSGQNRKANRVAWTLEKGEIPVGLYVCHRCDNPKCVRPDHLFLGTPTDNVRDMMAKGRNRPPVLSDEIRGRMAEGARLRCGVKNAASKLTDNVVREARALKTRKGIRKLARTLGVNHSTLIAAINRKTWRHVA